MFTCVGLDFASPTIWATLCVVPGFRVGVHPRTRVPDAISPTQILQVMVAVIVCTWFFFRLFFVALIVDLSSKKPNNKWHPPHGFRISTPPSSYATLGHGSPPFLRSSSALLKRDILCHSEPAACWDSIFSWHAPLPRFGSSAMLTAESRSMFLHGYLNWGWGVNILNRVQRSVIKKKGVDNLPASFRFCLCSFVQSLQPFHVHPKVFRRMVHQQVGFEIPQNTYRLPSSAPRECNIYTKSR